MISKDIFQAFQIQKKALSRMEAGAETYGEFDAETDQRDLYQEMEDELLDFMNYAAMQIIKLRTMRAKSLEIRR